jgi:hypothetical protein
VGNKPPVPFLYLPKPKLVTVLCRFLFILHLIFLFIEIRKPIFPFFFVGSIGVRMGLYHLSHFTTLFCVGVILRQGLVNHFCRLAFNHDPPDL